MTYKAFPTKVTCIICVVSLLLLLGCGTKTVYVTTRETQTNTNTYTRTVIERQEKQIQELRRNLDEERHQRANDQQTLQDTLRQLLANATSRHGSSQHLPEFVPVMLTIQDWQVTDTSYEKPWPTFELEVVSQRRVGTSVVLKLKERSTGRHYELPLPEKRDSIEFVTATLLPR